MKEDFSELIEYLNEKFANIDNQLRNKAEKSDVDNLANMVMLAHKVDRHEKWLHQVAEKLGIKLEY